jgi:DNA-binding response OmpR family regulator
MTMQVLTLGRQKVIERVVRSLAGNDISVTTCFSIEDAVANLKRQKFDLALIDGYLDDLQNVCNRITWQYRTPLVLIVNGSQADWEILRSLDVDGFIPEESSNIELVAYFNAIARRSCPAAASARVLIIEDDEPTIESLRLAFQVYWPEASITCTSCGKEGIQTARQDPVDVILLDLVLPDISGYEVLNSIRSFCQAPVIITSASHSRDDVLKAMISGADDYVLKPFKPLDLLNRIKTQVN